MGCNVNTEFWRNSEGSVLREAVVDTPLCVCASSVPSSYKEQCLCSFSLHLQGNCCINVCLSVRKHYLLPCPFKVTFIKYMTSSCW